MNFQVNSAARLMEQEKTVSEDGLESNFCVNSLGGDTIK